MFCLDAERASWRLLSTGWYTSYCITQVTTLCLGATLCLCTGSTDGHVALWPLDKKLESDGKGSTEKLFSCETVRGRICISSKLTWVARFKIHQNCIKSLATVQLSDAEVLLATAGDDGAVAFSRMSFGKMAMKEIPSQPVVDAPADQEGPLRDSSATTSTLLMPKAHASAVTALQLLHTSNSESDSPNSPQQYRFMTSSNDQRLKTWRLTIDIEKPGVQGFAVSKVRNEATAIADVSSTDLVRDEEVGKGGVVVAGIGLEVWAME